MTVSIDPSLDTHDRTKSSKLNASLVRQHPSSPKFTRRAAQRAVRKRSSNNLRGSCQSSVRYLNPGHS